ncbi:MAG: TonB-dependent receptor plug domain-containing protein [Bacteroidota bacterium]
MKRVNTLFWVLLLSACFTGLQAQRAISGLVADEDGVPLIGASVLVVGTTTGTVTDLDGMYRLDVPANAESLIFSYTGFENQTVNLMAGKDVYDIVLSSGLQLTEIVVSGQGVGIERKRLTSTVDVITSDQLELAPVTQLDQILQSRLPGAQIRQSSGQAGTAAIIRNRGPITANGSTTPVIIIDGVRVDNLNSNPQLNVGTGGASSSALADIPVESIERIEFIRGGAATTLYGADAANGVLQIFTKRGTAGQNRLTGGVMMGAMVGEREFLRFQETGDILYEPGLVQQYRLGVDGGNDRVTYNFAGSFYNDDGFIDINTQRRISGRFGLQANLSDKLTYSGSAAFTSNFFTRDYNANTSFARYGDLEGGDFGLLDELTDEEIDQITEDLRVEGQETDITDAVRRFQTSQQLTYKPFAGFTSRLIVGLDNRTNRAEDLQTNALLIAKGNVGPGTADRGNIERATRNFLTLTTDLALSYVKDVGDFSFTTQAGGQLIRSQDEQIEITATNLVEGSISLNNTAEREVQEFFRAVAFGGFYIAENIGYKNKLFLDLGLRWDFNSAFGEDIGLVNLKRAGIRYSLTDEPFMQQGGLADIITRMSFRANYGEASNFPTPFARDQTFTATPFLGSPSYSFGNPGNTALGPEVVTTIEVGADVSFLKGRVGGSITYYESTTEDALFTPPGIPSSGQLAQQANVGEIENTGFEFEAFVKVIETPDIDFVVNGSLITNENVVTSSGGAAEFNVGGFTFLGSFVKEGLPLGYLRGDIARINDAGELEIERLANLGKTNPDGYGTLGFNFRWKRLNIFGSADYQYGAQAVAVDDVLRFFGGVADEDRFPPEIAATPGLSFFDLAGYWVEDANFFKVRNLGISYSLNVDNTPFSYLKLGFNVRNPIVTGSASFDPEVTGAGLQAQNGFSGGGFGFGTESAPKQFLFSVDFGF